jgi:hypothetical protein
MFKNLSKKEISIITVISGLSLLAIVIHGYFFGISDQEIFIPYILKSANPNLFLGDLLFTQGSANASLFYFLVGFFTKYIDVQTIFFIGYLIFQTAFFISIYRLAYVLTKRRDLAVISLVPFLLPKFIGGTANYTYDTFFGYRSVGLIFLIFYLTYLFERKFNKAAVVAAVGIWFHPLSIIPNLLLLPVLVIAQNKPSRRISALLKVVSLFILLLLPFFLFSKTNVLNNFSNTFDTSWLEIIKSRDDYLFISTWSITAWAALGLYLTPIALFSGRINRKYWQILKLIVLTSLTVFLVNAFLLEVLKVPAIAQFQLVRSITPLAYVGLVMAVYFLSSKNFWQKTLGLLGFITLSSNEFGPFMMLTAIYAVSAAIKGLINPLPKISIKYFSIILMLTILVYMFTNNMDIRKIYTRIQYPKARSDWIDVQKWAKANTKEDDIFLVPPAQTGFRLFSQRSIIGDIKDGATVIYSPKYANQWDYRMFKLSAYKSFGRRQFEDLKAELNFDYFIAAKTQKIDMTPSYSNKSFNVYKY